MVNEKNKRYETEWSFSFENVGKSIDKALGGMGGETITENFSVPRDGVQTARIVIGGSVGKTTISALPAGSPNLFEADVKHMGELEFSESGDTEKTITLKHRQLKDLLGPIKRSWGSWNEDLYLHVRINPDFPIRLDLHGGVGPADFNLAQLNLTGLDIDGGVGPVKLDLPNTAAPYHVDVDGGVGGITINTPAAPHLRLSLEGGVGAAVLNIPTDASMDVKIEGGVGGITVNAAPGVAMRLEADGGIGSINVPRVMRQLKETGDFVSKGGIWESEGYSLSTRRVTIDYNGGIGGFRIKQDAVQIV
jgi:hypothetical protein